MKFSSQSTTTFSPQVIRLLITYDVSLRFNTELFTHTYDNPKSADVVLLQRGPFNEVPVATARLAQAL